LEQEPLVPQPSPLPDPREYLNATLRTTQALDREVLAILHQARLDTNRMLREIESRTNLGIGASIRREQLQLIRRNLFRQQAATWRRLGDAIRARRFEAASKVVEIGRQMDAVLLESVGGLPDGREIAKAIAGAEIDAAEHAMDRMISRVSGDSYVDLSQRVYNSQVSFGSILDRKVNSALVRGLSAREFSREISDFINPNTPGGVRYAAMRLARTEINNAAHAVAIHSQADKPWVIGMRWRLSGSHPKPDECDKLAKGGPKGDGIYRKGETPKKPHPQCFCFVTPETPTDNEFLDALINGEYNDYLKRFQRSQ
jgi:hypothetical protein